MNPHQKLEMANLNAGNKSTILSLLFIRTKQIIKSGEYNSALAFFVIIQLYVAETRLFAIKPKYPVHQ